MLYDELMRLKSLVLCDTSERVNEKILKRHTRELVDTVDDNFDSITSSINSLKQIHSLDANWR